MRVENIRIQKYRSIDDVVISFPANKPVVLFGPNNAGKSNILSAIDRLLGEKYPTYIEMLESDYFMRDKATHPTASIAAQFSEAYYIDRRGVSYQTIVLTYGYNGDLTENLIHDGRGNRLYVTNEQRAACQSYLIDAERNIQSAFNYSSKYSLLSKFSHQIHKALSATHKEELSAAFEQIKKLRNSVISLNNFQLHSKVLLKDSYTPWLWIFRRMTPITMPNPCVSMPKKATISVALRNLEQVSSKCC